ncbi:MAG TPA: hypothetical protein PLS38_10110 [Solirubrobacterales bacterium]|nr:hypothetical protein [Solirubrobacterales bacterium]
MKGFAVAAVSFALLGIAGCGGSDSSGSPDEDQIRQVASDFSAAIADGDYAAACDLFAPESVQFFEVQKQIPGGCPGVLKVTYGNMSDADVEALAEVESLEVKGDKATADLGGGESAGYQKINGNWVMSLE